MLSPCTRQKIQEYSKPVCNLGRIINAGICPDALCLLLGTAALHILAVHAKCFTRKAINIAIKNKTYAVWWA